MPLTKNILIVEDDDDIARSLKALLEAEGHVVAVAGNGRAALEHLFTAAVAPSIIILDLMMPVMDGFQFRDEQEKHAKIASIPVVIMTAGGNIETSKIRLGAKAYITKPLDADDILDVIRKHAL